MKYMTFNSSCTYAGIANMLEVFDIDKEDYEIAIGMKLPFLFKYDNVSMTYTTGISLQNKVLFNLYLNTLGVNFIDAFCSKQEVLQLFKKTNRPMLIGILLETHGKHAVIFREHRESKYVFMNNRYQNSAEPKEYIYDENELQSRIEEPIVVGWLESCSPQNTSFVLELKESLSVLHKYNNEIRSFCEVRQSFETLQSTMNRLFRPLLLDGLTMMQLVGNEKMSMLLKQLQVQYLTALKKKSALTLKDVLIMEQLDNAFTEYATLINGQLARCIDYGNLI